MRPTFKDSKDALEHLLKNITDPLSDTELDGIDKDTLATEEDFVVRNNLNKGSMMNKNATKEVKGDYEGWKNHATWAVALWIDNDQGLNEMVLEMAREAKENNPTDSDENSYSEAVVSLSDSIKEFVEQENPVADEATMWSDLMAGALSDVEWREIAEHELSKLS